MTAASRARASDHSLFRRCRRLAAAALAFGLSAASAVEPVPSKPWPARLQAELAALDAQSKAKIGVYVRDLDTGESMSWQAEQRWYIASMVKLPVAIAVLRGLDRGQYTLDTHVTLRAADYVDGAGPTSSLAVGTPLSVRFLLEQMMVHSDNTASDVLIDLVGIAEVNTVVDSLVPDGFWRITSLSDVRRLIYGNLVPSAERLSGQDLLLLRRQHSDAERLQLLSRLVETPVARFRMPTLDAAYNAYYTTGLNSARLDAYGELLALVADGKTLTPKSTDYLLQVMSRAATGTYRLKAGLPPGTRFAHKTGTQRRRICDAGIARTSDPGSQRRLAVVACARDDSSLESSEFALAEVGAAICRTGLLTHGITDVSHCHPVPRPDRLPADPER